VSDDTQTTKDSKSYIRLKNYRHTNRLNGKCADCGKPSEKYRCAECSAKKNERERHDRRYYKEHGICPVCKQVSIGSDESMCPECLAKEYTYQMSKRNANEESRAKYTEQHRIWAQMKYERIRLMGFAQDVGNAKQTAVIRLVEYAGRKTEGVNLPKRSTRYQSVSIAKRTAYVSFAMNRASPVTNYVNGIIR
jgi:hypothetical protein